MVAAREAIPAARVTTAQTRGVLNARGRGRGADAVADRGRGIGSARGRSNDTRSKAKQHVSTTAAHTSQAASSSQNNRGRGRGSKRKGQQTEQTMEDTIAGPPSGRSRAGTYSIGPGSTYHLLFGDDQQSGLPDLNVVVPEEIADEIQITQNAPE